MKYFLHDSNAFQDEKVTELYMEYGYEGLGLFFTILEKIAAQEKPIKTQVLKKQLNVGKKLEKCWSFMEEIGIISSNNGETFNENLLKFSEKYQIKKEKTRERVAEWRKNQTDTENVTRYERVSNASKVKVSKVNNKEISKEAHAAAMLEFETFWAKYDKKVDRKKCEAKWFKISQKDREVILQTVEAYVKANADVQFRKNPYTYLHGQCWNDNIPGLFRQAQADGRKIIGYVPTYDQDDWRDGKETILSKRPIYEGDSIPVTIVWLGEGESYEAVA